MEKRNLQSVVYVAASTAVAMLFIAACAGALWRSLRVPGRTPY